MFAWLFVENGLCLLLIKKFYELPKKVEG